MAVSMLERQRTQQLFSSRNWKLEDKRDQGHSVRPTLKVWKLHEALLVGVLAESPRELESDVHSNGNSERCPDWSVTELFKCRLRSSFPAFPSRLKGHWVLSSTIRVGLLPLAGQSPEDSPQISQKCAFQICQAFLNAITLTIMTNSNTRHLSS